ncbi:MAG: S1-like domain-containing RNA-binding protein [Desulfobulbaceae bacterium]|nr:S1-like domain-containing RNA-binding protein [Desulfobulbaceae bacterium]HIJ78254.1 GntR family transcriptional regulator [Deltaproteobacteria bacterium]
MAQIGRFNKLKVKRTRDYGVHLDGGESGDIILKYREVPKDCQAGDEIEVFLYQDRDDHLRATTQKPLVTVGQFACLRVVGSTPTGAYLDWGLDRDLFVPIREQREAMTTGKSYVVFVFLDEKNNRITASSKLDKFLSMESWSFKEGQEVELIIYDQTDLGYKAIVNHSHGGMIYQNEVFQKLAIGQQLKGYIKKIREDLKIDLSLQKPGYQGVDNISKVILQVLTDHGGHLTITDKSEPEAIYALFGVSKKIFKKAIGGLYKKRLIAIDASGVRLIK